MLRESWSNIQLLILLSFGSFLILAARKVLKDIAAVIKRWILNGFDHPHNRDWVETKAILEPFHYGVQSLVSAQKSLWYISIEVVKRRGGCEIDVSECLYR